MARTARDRNPPLPSRRLKQPHGLLRRVSNYAVIVFRDPLALGTGLVGYSAGLLALGPGWLAGLAAGAMFVGGTFGAMQARREQIEAYRRRHDPHWRPPSAGEATRLMLRGEATLDDLVRVPGFGRLAMGTGAGIVAGLSLAAGNPQAALGMGLLSAGHTTFAANDILKTQTAAQLARRAVTAASGRIPAAPDSLLARIRRLVTLPVVGLRHAGGIGRILLGDPMGLGSIVFATALGVLNLGIGPAGIGASLALFGGGVAQVLIDRRQDIEVYLAQHGLARSSTRSAAVGPRRAIRALFEGGAGTLVQAATYALTALATPAPLRAFATAGFALAALLIGGTKTAQAWERAGKAERAPEPSARPLNSAPGDAPAPMAPRSPYLDAPQVIAQVRPVLAAPNVTAVTGPPRNSAPSAGAASPPAPRPDATAGPTIARRRNPGPRP